MKDIYLSKSQIKMFTNCSYQWMFRYVMQLKVPPSGAMKLGTTSHDTWGFNYKQKADSRKDKPVDELTDYFEKAWKDGLTRDEVVFEGDDTKDSLLTTGVGIIKAHHRLISPKVQPRSASEVEEKIELIMGNGEHQLKMVGIIDLTDENGVIRENKTFSKRPNQSMVDKDIDLSTYALMKRLKTKEVEPAVAMDVVIKNKTPDAITLTSHREVEQLRFHRDRIAKIAKAIRNEDFIPNTEWWGCSKERCGYWSRCAGRGLVTVDLAANKTEENHATQE